MRPHDTSPPELTPIDHNAAPGDFIDRLAARMLQLNALMVATTREAIELCEVARDAARAASSQRSPRVGFAASVPSQTAASATPQGQAAALSDTAEAKLLFWTSPEESIHSAKIVSAVLELTSTTLQNMRVAGEGPDYIKRGGRVYYCKRDVVTWMRGETGNRRAIVNSSRPAT